MRDTNTPAGRRVCRSLLLRWPDASVAHTVAFQRHCAAPQANAERPGVGLEFSFRLLGPARPDEEIVFRWEIMGRERSERLRGDVCTLRSEALGPGCVAARERDAYILLEDFSRSRAAERGW